MLSFQRFADKKKTEHTPAWKYSAKYSKAAWSLFGVTVRPDGPARIRMDNLQGRLKIRVAKLQARNPGNETLANISTLVHNPEFVNAFYTGTPQASSLMFAEAQFRGITDTRAWKEVFPEEFFERTYTDDIGTVQTYGEPIKTASVKYMLGESMAYCMMQELFEYRRRFKMGLYQNRLFAEMDLMFADTLMHPNTARVYELDGTVYILIGEVHTPVGCIRRSLNAITTGKFFVDLVAACPDIRFDMFSENGPRTNMPNTPRMIEKDEENEEEDDDEVVVVESSGGAGAGSSTSSSTNRTEADKRAERLFEKQNSCQDRLAFIYMRRKKALLEGKSIEDINAKLIQDGIYDPERDDDGSFSTNGGFLSSSGLYFFTAYPSAHAWKSKGVLGNVRLHNEDIRSSKGESHADDARSREEARTLASNPRLAPILDSTRELQSDRMFRDPQLKVTMDDILAVNFQDLTMTFAREDPFKALAKALGGSVPGLGGEIGDFLRSIREFNHAVAGRGAGAHDDDDDDDDDELREEKQRYLDAGCRIVSATADRIVVTFERVLLKKFERLAPELQRRLQTAFQRFIDQYNPRVVPMNMMPTILEAAVTDFYAMTRALVDTSGGQGRKRVIMFQGGSAHIENWSFVLHNMGAREFIYGSPKDPHAFFAHSIKRIDAVNLDAVRQRLIALDVLQPRMTFTSEERRLVQRIYNTIDSIKSSVVRADTFEQVWTLFDRILEPDNGLFRQCIRTVHDNSDLGDNAGRTTNNRPFEVLALLGTKIKLALEMFIVDLTTLQRTTNTESVLKKAQFQMSDQRGALLARIQQLQRAATDGVLISKRKNAA